MTSVYLHTLGACLGYSKRCLERVLGALQGLPDLGRLDEPSPLDLLVYGGLRQ